MLSVFMPNAVAPKCFLATNTLAYYAEARRSLGEGEEVGPVWNRLRMCRSTVKNISTCIYNLTSHICSIPANEAFAPHLLRSSQAWGAPSTTLVPRNGGDILIRSYFLGPTMQIVPLGRISKTREY